MRPIFGPSRSIVWEPLSCSNKPSTCLNLTLRISCKRNADGQFAHLENHRHVEILRLAAFYVLTPCVRKYDYAESRHVN